MRLGLALSFTVSVPVTLLKTKNAGPFGAAFETGSTLGSALDGGSLIALGSLQRRGRDVGLLAQAGEFGLLCEKLDEVGNLAVAAGFQRFLNTSDHRAKFGRTFGVELFDLIGLLGDNMVGVIAIELNLVKAGAVVEVAKAHEADFLESREATINRHQIAGRVGEIAVDLLDASRLRSLDQGFKNRNARLGDPQTSCF